MNPHIDTAAPVSARARKLAILLRCLSKLPRAWRRRLFNGIGGAALMPFADAAYIAARVPLGALFGAGADPRAWLRAWPALATVAVRDLAIPAPHGQVAARYYTPAGACRHAPLMWMHGGAFIGGNLDMAESHWVGLALAARGVPVLAVDYRKCLNGVHYPAPSDDVLGAWRWLRDHGDAHGLAHGLWHLGGASAGANLAAGVAKRLRDAGERAPASLMLAYPTLHAGLPPIDPAQAAIIERACGAATMTSAWVRAMNLNYVGADAMLDDPCAIPACGDLANLPPVYVLNAQFDAFRASGEAFAAAVAAAGGSVLCESVVGAFHGSLTPAAAQSEAQIDSLARWIAEHDSGRASAPSAREAADGRS